MKPKIHKLQKNNIKTVSKKALLLILTVSFLTSCGPKRMSCYGKRCVEISKKPTTGINSRSSKIS